MTEPHRLERWSGRDSGREAQSAKWILRHVFNYCLLCNSPDHQAQDCWIPQHRYYSGLVYGRIYADPPVYRAWLDAMPFGEVEPEWARERVTDVRAWAADQAFKPRQPTAPERVQA